MSTSRLVAGWALVALVTSACVAVSQDSIHLALRLEEGQSYRMRVTIEQEITQTVTGTEMQITQTTGGVYRFDVKEVDRDGVARVGWVHESVRFSQASPAGRIEYDSDDTTAVENPLTQAYDALVGREFSARIAPSGVVSDVEGMDEILDEMLSDMDTALAGQLRAVLSKQINDEAMADMLTGAMGFYPAEPVAVGESWSRTISLTTMLPVITENTWTLRELKDGLAVIDVNSKVDSDPEAPPIQMGPVSLKMSLSGQQTGTIEVDQASGWLLRGVVRQEFSGESSVAGMPELEQSWPITISGTVTTESL